MAAIILQGRAKVVEIDPVEPTRIIGERCNALGYKIVKQSVEEGNWDLIVDRAREQAQAGADIINVNMVGTCKAETEVLPRIIERIAEAVDIPLSIDFGTHEALEAALKVAPGRALINSVNGEESKLNPTLELAAKYNAALIALTCNDGGIPRKAAERLQVARQIVERAKTFDLGLDDLLFDTVCLGVGTDPEAGPVTFETCRLVREEFGANIILGASNAAYGLPVRRRMNAAYLAMAIGAGMNVAITDVTLPEFRWAILSADCCVGRDEYGTRYIQAYRAEMKEKASEEQVQMEAFTNA